MAFNINGTVLNSSQIPFGTTQFAISANNNTQEVLRVDASGIMYTRQNPMFYAYNNASPATNFTANTWNLISYSYTAINKNSCFSTSTSRFTAPVEGFYLFTANCYLLKRTSAGVGDYWHPTFYINGNYIATIGIRGQGLDNGYDMDANVTRILYLNQNDNVEHRIYASGGSVLQYLPYTQHFAGVLLG